MSETEVKCTTDGSPHYEKLTPVQCVLQNDLLLDKILHFALMDDDKKENRKTINSTKLVQHFWLERVDAVLHKSEGSKIQLFEFHKHEWRIKRFVEAFATSPSTLVYRIPPFNLAFNGHLHSNLPRTVRNDLLSRCGSALVKLNISVYKEQCWYDVESVLSRKETPFTLNKLEILNITIEFNENPKNFDLYARINPLIKSIIDECECLQEICIGVVMCMGVVPYILKNLKLPMTLTKATLTWNSEPGLLAKILVENPLPNLIALVLKIHLGNTDLCIFTNEVETVLAHFCKQLLQLDIAIHDFYRSRAVKINLPVMQRLKMFSCLTTNIEWLTPESKSLDFCLPALKTIRLPQKSIKMLRYWTQNGTFCFVEEANISLEQPFGEEVPDDVLLLEQMRQVKQTMPNIRDLTLTISFDKQSSFIEFILQEMRSLQKLLIFVSNCPEYYTMDELDAWFIELSPHEEFRVLLGQRESTNKEKSTKGIMKDLKKLEISYRATFQARYQLSRFSWNFERDEEKNKNKRSGEDSAEASESDLISESETSSEEYNEDYGEVSETDPSSEDGSSGEPNDEDSDVDGTKENENFSDEEQDD